MASVANRAHCRRNPRAKKEKGQSRRELSERLDVGRPEMFGGLLVPNISGSMGSDCGPLRRRHSAQKAVPFPMVVGRWDRIMNEISRSKRIKNVLRLQVVRERARQPRDGSSGQVSKRSNQRLLERLEAENAQLRDSVVDLMLQIQALRDGAK